MRALARAPPVRRSGALAGGRLIHSDGRHGLIMASPSSVVRCLRYPDSAAAAHFANFGGDWARRGGRTKENHLQFWRACARLWGRGGWAEFDRRPDEAKSAVRGGRVAGVASGCVPRHSAHGTVSGLRRTARHGREGPRRLRQLAPSEAGRQDSNFPITARLIDILLPSAPRPRGPCRRRAGRPETSGTTLASFAPPPQSPASPANKVHFLEVAHDETAGEANAVPAAPAEGWGWGDEAEGWLGPCSTGRRVRHACAARVPVVVAVASSIYDAAPRGVHG